MSGRDAKHLVSERVIQFKLKRCLSADARNGLLKPHPRPGGKPQRCEGTGIDPRTRRPRVARLLQAFGPANQRIGEVDGDVSQPL